MKLNIGIIDYGMGNLHSVAKAIASQGARVVVTDQRAKLRSVDLLVLPGVGSFGAAMATLARKKLDDFVRRWFFDGKSYLGICLGFQMLFERSEESPRVRGLGVLKGEVVKFRLPKKFHNKLQIPHMGWNTIARKNGTGCAALKGFAADDYFYFVHSYFPEPLDASVVCTNTNYGIDFCSSVAGESFFASQFHPEKSGRVGLKLIKNVLRSVPHVGDSSH